MGAPRKEEPPETTREHLAELARLTDTAGGTVVAVMTQRVEAPHPRLYIGEGKASELRELVKSSGSELVIFDEELSPAQGKNLESALGVRVMDRPELILDIFASRARTREAKMQVELAQLEYLLPRLTRMWRHLSRIRGGIGLRGPGETQLETDRRLIGRRIADLKRKLENVARARAVQRRGREGTFRAALVGYTNAGKSSLLRTLAGADLFVEDRLFATLDSATRIVDVGSGHTALVTDTVGFIRKLPHDLIASFRSTLEEAREADLLLHVVDGSEPGWEERLSVGEEVLDELDLLDRPRVLVFNKTDRMTHLEERLIRDRVRATEPLSSVFLSAHREESMEGLRAILRSRIRATLLPVRFVIRAEDGRSLASLYREGEVLRREERNGKIELLARVPGALVAQLRELEGVEVLTGSQGES